MNYLALSFQKDLNDDGPFFLWTLIESLTSLQLFQLLWDTAYRRVSLLQKVFACNANNDHA